MMRIISMRAEQKMINDCSNGTNHIKERTFMARTSGQYQRWQILELLLHWHGHFSSHDLVSLTGVGRVQYSRDVKEYEQKFPGQLNYDTVRKRYLPSPEFQPKLSNCTLADYQALILSDESTIPVEILSVANLWGGVPSPIRQNLSKIRQAIAEKRAMHIHYGSLTHPEGQWREVVPHSLVCTGMRWHMRAYCRNNHDFRDFVLGRLLSPVNILAYAETEETAAQDHHWQNTLTLKLVVNPALSENQQRLVANEYYEGNALELPTRGPLVPYLLQLYQVQLLEDAPTSQLLVAAEPNKVKPYLFDT